MVLLDIFTRGPIVTTSPPLHNTISLSNPNILATRHLALCGITNYETKSANNG